MYSDSLLVPHYAAATTSVLPLPRHSGTSRRGSTKHVVASHFNLQWRIDLRLSFFRLFCSPSLSHPLLHSHFSFLYPLPTCYARARARLFLVASLLVSLPFSRFCICLSRITVTVSVSFCDRIAHLVPSLCALNASVPSPLTVGKRASPSRT